MLSPSVGTGAVVVQFPSTRYSTVAPSSVPPTVKLPSLVKKNPPLSQSPYQVSVLAHLELLCLE
ncbi:hypothetical protein [Vibrio cyclitrophicus]|uniref:hypothetical protein n=1 Tax=Vibrio cyclitrophicus TaxID=47951 RepID=UPI0039999C99